MLKKILKKTFIMVCLFLGICLCDVNHVEAKEELKSGKVSVYDDFEEETKAFSLDKSGVLYFELNSTMIYNLNASSEKDIEISTGKQGIKFTLSVYENKTAYYNEEKAVYTESIKMTISKGEKTTEYWYWPGKKMSKGYCVMSFKTYGNADIKCSYKVTYYKDFASSLKIPSSLNIKTESYKEFKITDIKPSGALHGAVFTSSNPKIAEVCFDGSNVVGVYGVKAGTCTITAKLENGKTYKCKVKVTDPSPRLNYTSCELYKGETIALKLKFAHKKVTWSTSNSKIATVDSKGKVKGKGIGSCTISAKCNGKTYKTKIKVVYQSPDFTAFLTDYNTRDNYFTVVFRNYSNKKITIYSKDAYCMDVDYKSYDRKLYLSGNKDITIDPKKSKTVKFKVKGDITWYDYHDFTVRYYFSFDGKKYLGSCWDEDSVYKDGKKWYNTYWD